jgi:hypothetical protein
MIVPQREAIGPDVRSIIWRRKAPSNAPKESAGNPPDASDKIPISFKDWRADGGTSKRTANSGSSSASSSVALSSPVKGVAGAASFEDPGTFGVGRPATGVGGGGGSPKPSGNKDSGPCCPSAGKANAKTRALATKRPLFDILSVNDANLFPYLRTAIRYVHYHPLPLPQPSAGNSKPMPLAATDRNRKNGISRKYANLLSLLSCIYTKNPKSGKLLSADAKAIYRRYRHG